MFFESDVVIIEGENILIPLNPEWLHVFQSLHLIIRGPTLRQLESRQLSGREDVTEIIR